MFELVNYGECPRAHRTTTCSEHHCTDAVPTQLRGRIPSTSPLHPDDKKDDMPTQMRAVRTRDATITALAELIAERGYPRTSVTDIVEAAGLTKGHCTSTSSKEATVTALLDTASGRYEFLDHYQSIPEAPPRQEVLSC